MFYFSYQISLDFMLSVSLREPTKHFVFVELHPTALETPFISLPAANTKEFEKAVRRSIFRTLNEGQLKLN